jgi:outer membrane protein
VTKTAFNVPLLALGFAFLTCAQSQPGKVGIIHIQNAIISTKDGQKAASELQVRFAPRSKELEKKQAEIAGLRDQMQRGSNTMNEDAKQKLARDIDQKTRAFNRDTEDAQTEYDQEQQKILQDLGQRIMAVIDKYARDNGYAVILDVSSPQTPVLYAANGIDITNDIVTLYDKNAPSAAPAAPAARPAPSVSRPSSPIPAAKPPSAAKKP